MKLLTNAPGVLYAPAFSTIIQDLAFKVLLYKQCTLVIGISVFCCVLLYSAALCFVF